MTVSRYRSLQSKFSELDTDSDGSITFGDLQEVLEGQAAQEDRTARAVQADQDIQEYLEAQVGQMVSEDQVADHHPNLRRTADQQQ